MSGNDKALTAERRDSIVASFGRQGVLLGMGGRMASLDMGRCTLELPFGDAVAQQHGFFAGGAIGTLADVAGGYAAMSVAPAGHDVLTLEYKINFLRPATGAMLIAEAAVLRAGRLMIVTRVDVFDAERRLCAAMQQSIVPHAAAKAAS
ncbi:PaaI family thioesterase [Sphingomonas sp. 2R-10]|uniref:PaaI family thioesterase n=1 Tax=Sphingomonas sp. 2R-10 TaxID=3045148 RepID=UPI000F7AB357|nr:PaaI family thioesterase [Sphingomonas sp. 2R-10]MDJ0277157.1 PaaI family thioesterase [Sphingomonas sp. 2R-10]